MAAATGGKPAKRAAKQATTTKAPAKQPAKPAGLGPLDKLGKLATQKPAGGSKRPSLTARGVGIVAGGVLLGVGAGFAIERALIGHEHRRDDPEAGEPFGGIRGKPATVTSHDGTELYVEELGGGPCLVFCHGFSLNQDIWHYQRRDLPASFRCVFFDQRGHGRSGSARDDDYSLHALARDLKAVIDWTGEDRVVVVAHSMAGMAALELASAFPEELGSRVAGLVLLDTTFADVLHGMAASVTSRATATVKRAVLSAGLKFLGQDPKRAQALRRRGSDLGYLGTRLFGFGPKPSPAQVAFVDRTLAATDAEIWAKAFPSLLDFDHSEVLGRIDVPTLVAVGDKDRLTPVTAARHMAEKISGARLLILEDAGHMAMLEEHEVLNAEIAAFARQVLRPTSTSTRPRRRPRS
jgi:pimeloyl-ACP methyl ester carboxylesterase